MNFLKFIWRLGHAVFPSVFLQLEYWRRNKTYEKDLWLVKYFCNKSSISVDVGANQGIFSCYMAKFSKQVICFECNPSLFPRLESILPKNAFLYKEALSNRDGLADLRYDPENAGIGTIEIKNSLSNNSGIKQVISQQITTNCLDNYSLSDVSFIKIDIEGHEFSCLEGSKKLLAACHPVLLIEIEERHCSGNLEAVQSFLKDFSYHPFIISDNGLYLIPVHDLGSYSQSRYNNFWFLPCA